MIGFEWTVAKFFWYMFFMYFTFCYFTFYGMMAVAVTPNYHIAAVLASAFYGSWNLFSGFVVPRPVSIFNLKIHQITLHYYYILYFFIFLITENASVVELVLLGKSCSLELIWIICITIWKYNRHIGNGRCYSAGIYKKLLWYHT
jgi:hypothetical protein